MKSIIFLLLVGISISCFGHSTEDPRVRHGGTIVISGVKWHDHIDADGSVYRFLDANNDGTYEGVSGIGPIGELFPIPGSSSRPQSPTPPAEVPSGDEPTPPTPAEDTGANPSAEVDIPPAPVQPPQTPTPGLEVGETSIQSLQKKRVYVSLPPQPQTPLCQNDMPTATAIRITNVIHEKHPKRLIITFENASSRYIQLKDPFLRIAIISKDLKIRAVSQVKNRNTYGSTLLFALRNKKKTVKTAGIFTLGWHIRKKTIDYRADKNMYGALFATELRYYIPKTGETLYDPENDSIVILYNCDSRHTFKGLKIGDTVQREHIIAEYPPPAAEAAPAAPSLFVRKAATTWGHLKRSE